MKDVLQANAAFYKAFSNFDLGAMEAVWSQQDTDVCIHPGWPPIIGWSVIRHSWSDIFAGTTYMRVAPSDEEVVMHGDVARVLCVENIYTLHETTAVQSQVATTHVFVRTNGLWRLVLHHGSPMAHRRAATMDVQA